MESSGENTLTFLCHWYVWSESLYKVEIRTLIRLDACWAALLNLQQQRVVNCTHYLPQREENNLIKFVIHWYQSVGLITELFFFFLNERSWISASPLKWGQQWSEGALDIQ